MSEWFFLWEECETDEECMSAMSCGGTDFDFSFIEDLEKRKSIQKTKALRDIKQISREEFLKRKKEIRNKIGL